MIFLIVSFLVSMISASTPLLIAASGELIAEKSGVLNLGVEGMMLMGAIAAFATAHATGSTSLGMLAAIGAGMMMALLFAFLTLTLLANQIASGLALTIFGRGFSALLGAGYVGIAAPTLSKLNIPILSHLPVIGPILFHHDVLVYGSFVMIGAIWWFLNRTHAGLILRAVGDSHDAAHATGYPVLRIRYAATAFGGAMAGLAGAYLSLSYSPLWAQDMTAGRGWIALALVTFSAWRPLWLLFGAYLFGGIMFLSLYLQGMGVPIPAPFISALPYLATVIVLVLISRDRRRIRLNQPACLGKSFHAAA
ncbi:MAG: ABC transporter permease [Rhodospirillales bacterium 20-60-12]|nr:MAG: ABC transporter permease [Rhodospirillales bacterium 20-60-12]HQT66143.1 ABC transporter permease [Acetobacteraceae bacterium]HQU02768.1 ABC transporter permease [Acetobacteraceae bacterium]